MSDDDRDDVFKENDAVRRLVGRNIKIARKRAGLTQEQLAVRLDTKQYTVANWERGRFEPKSHNLRRIALVLGVRFGWFYDDHDEDAA